MVKTRSTNVSLTGQGTYVTYPGGGSHVTPPVTEVLNSSSESITTYGGTRGDKACNHVKITSSLSSTFTGISWRQDSTHYQIGTFVNPCVSKHLGVHPLAGYSLGLEPDLTNCMAEAYATMRPTMTTSSNLTQFLAELKDFKMMFKLWDKHSSALKNAAAGHLNWSFGWRPFLKDIRTILKGILEFEERLSKFLKRAGSPQQRYFKTSLDQSVYTSPDGPASIGYPHWVKYIVTTNECIFHAKMCFTYRLPGYSANSLKIRAWLDALGANLNISTLWELIPFSWLVDWFVNVGDLLQRFDSKLLDPTLEISSMLYSLKRTGVCETYSSPWHTYGNSYQLIATHKFSTYKRWFGLPVTSKTLEFQAGQSAGRVLLGASLLKTRYGR